MSVKKRILSIVFNDMTHDSRVLKESTTLAESGYDLTVLALHAEGLALAEKVNGFEIKRLSVFSYRWTRFKILRPLIYIEIMMKVLFRYGGYDAYHIHDLEPLLLGYLLKRFSWSKSILIYDAHEYESEKNGLKGWMKTAITGVEGFCMPQVDGFITVSGRILDAYEEKYSLKKTILVHNAPIPQEVARNNKLRESLGIPEKKIIFLYQGALTHGRGVEQLLEAFGSDVGDDKCLVVMGYGLLQERVETAAAGSINIYFHEAVSPEVLLSYTASADVGISLIEPICLSYEYCLPNKLFEYAMAGLPILVSPLAEMKEKVETYKIGYVMEGLDAEALMKAVNKVKRNDLSVFEGNLKRFANVFNWKEEEKKLNALYKDLIGEA